MHVAIHQRHPIRPFHLHLCLQLFQPAHSSAQVFGMAHAMCAMRRVSISGAPYFSFCHCCAVVAACILWLAGGVQASIRNFMLHIAPDNRLPTEATGVLRARHS